MGRKLGRTRKHFSLYLAGLIVVALSACASFDAMQNRQESTSFIRRAQALMGQGDFEGAMKESRETLARSQQSPPGDDALFYMALISAHDGNPKKDYHKAHGFFSRIIKEFPQSSRAEEAKIWIGVLEAIEKTKQVDIQIEEKKKELSK